MTGMKTTLIKTASWAILALTVPVAASAEVGDTVRAVTPLFDPIVVEDSIPDISGFREGYNPYGKNKDSDTSGDSDTIETRQRLSRRIGTPATDAGVSPLGAAVWSMAFDTPKGPGGMTPSVGLAYSSHSGIGNAGWGISISGFSCITRGTKTLYHDGMVRGVRYDSGDALYLDGRRLLLSTGVEGTSGAVYVPEGDPYTKVTVTSYDQTAGPISFEVHSPDGMVSFYGTAVDARLSITYGGSTRYHSWYISRRNDPNGNYAEYSYMQDDLTVYPEAITYGKNINTGTGADNQIRFYYTNAHSNTVRTFVIGGTQGSVRKCLERVQTKTGSSVYREYLLSYAPISDGSTVKYERLSTITCRNGNGEEMNPVSLEWGLLPGYTQATDVLDVSTNDNYSMIEKQDSLLFAADLNGDGLADIIRISYCKHYLYNNYNESYIQWRTYVYVHRSVRDGNGNITYLPHLRYNIGGQVDFDDWKEHIGNNIVTDIDGDGLNDLIIPYFTELPYSSAQIEFKCIMGNKVRDGNLQVPGLTLPLMAAEDIPPIVTGDLDGNGAEDVIFLENKKSGGYYYLGISFSVPSGSRNFVNIPLALPQKPKRLFTGDFNSDGLPDLIALYDGGYKIFYNNGGSTQSALFSNSNSASGSSLSSKWRVEQGDFNGDGLVDFVYVGEGSPDYYFAVNNGNGTFAVSLALTSDIHDQGTDKDDRRFTLTPMDIDRDGFTDLVISKAEFWSGDFLHTLTAWFVSDGSSLSEKRRVISYGLIDEAGSQNIMCADFDGDGWPELANNGADWYTNATAIADGCHIRVYHSPGFSHSSGRLTGATDALGAAASFTYGTSADPALCVQAYGSTFPMADIHSPMTLVSTVTKDDGLTGTHTVDYRYSGLKAHLQGKGLLGFTDTAARDNQTGVTTQSGIKSWNGTHFVPSQAYNATTMGYASDSTVITFSVQPNAASRYMSFPVEKWHMDMDGNTDVTTTGYNVIEGYVTVERTEYGNSSMYREANYLDQVKKGNRWLPRTITRSQKHADDPSAYTTTTSITYSESGNPLTVTEHSGTDEALTTSTTYDTWGNATSVSRSGLGVSAFSDNTAYDPTGRFVTRRYRSPDGEDVSFTHDAWGNVLTETDAAEASNPLTTTWERDAWGDVQSITDPMGITENFIYGWGSSSSSRYYIYSNAAGKAPKRTWYDNRGREHVRWTRVKKNVESTETIHLNTRGSVAQVERTVGTRTDYEAYAYDSRDRVYWSYATGSSPTTYSYGNRTRTAVQNSREYTTTYDGWGNVLTSSDPVSSVAYTYGSIGKPVSITSGNSQVTIQYDQAGRKTQMTDPDAGTSTYAYSADGKLLQQTDGRGILTQNSYDALGRLTASVCGSVATTYTYGTSGHGKLRLTKAQTGNMSDEYSYDQYGHVYFSKRTFPDGVQMGHTYTYNSLGHLTHHTYPSNFTITYTYDANGYRQGIYAGTAHIWYIQSYDGFITRYGYGNTTVTDSVSAAGQLLDRYVRKNGQDGKLCRMEFSWDSAYGNMTSRTGVNAPGTAETFTYDSLDRLTGVSQGSSVTDAITYGNDGNILSRTGMGAYGYLSSKPHAVTRVDNTDYLITSASQRIDYHPFGKAELITEGGNSQRLFYGPDGTRWLQVDSINGQVAAKTYYDDDFEMRVAGGHTYRYNYLEEGLLTYMYDSSITDHYYLLTDNVGSVTHIVNGEGGTMFDAGYDAWGKQTVTKNLIGFFRGYGGHEMLPQYRLVNMDGRLYDYSLGRFLSPDNYVQEPGNSQSFNRYTYCLNNPLKYTDPDGESFLVALLTSTFIGAAISASSYSISALLAKQFSWSNFFKATEMGAFAGALSTGLGYLGISNNLTNNIGFKMLSQATNTFATNALFGNKISRSDIGGITAGTLVSILLPNFTPTSGNAFKNGVGETIYNTFIGEVSGLAQGAAKGLIEGDAKYLFQGVLGGAISGFSRSVALNVLMGAPYKVGYEQGNYTQTGIIRKGGIIGFGIKSYYKIQAKKNKVDFDKNEITEGITLGRNAYSVGGNPGTTFHELFHIRDIENMGWGEFYGRWLEEMIRYGFNGAYSQKNTLENNATLAEYYYLKSIR